MRFLWASIMVLLSAGGVSSAGAAEAAADFPNLAHLTSVEGLPTDSLAARMFMAGFRSTFVDEYFLTERAGASDGERPASEPLTNRFRLVEGDPFGDEWQVQLTIMGWWDAGPGVPPPADTTGARVRGAGLRVNVAVLSAAAASVGARPIPTREDLTLEVPLKPRRDFFAHAGRMVGLLTIEALHHQSGDLDEDARLRLDRAVRLPVIERRAPSPHR
jgi:hypothetical protein